MPEPIEMPDPLQESAEGAVPEAPVEQPALDQPTEEFYRFKHRDFEAELPADAVRAIAEKLGYEKAEAVVNQLQVARDAQTLYNNAKLYYEQAAQLQPKEPPVEERWQQHVQREAQAPRRQPTPQEPDNIDPLGILQALDRRTQAFERYIDEQNQRMQWEMQQKNEQLVDNAIRGYGEWQKQLKEDGWPDYKIPPLEYLFGEAKRFGMLQNGAPLKDVYSNLHKMMYTDDYAQAAVNKQMAKLRDPKARVAVPTGPAATPPPRQPANPIDGMTLKDLLPEGKY